MTHLMLANCLIIVFGGCGLLCWRVCPQVKACNKGFGTCKSFIMCAAPALIFAAHNYYDTLHVALETQNCVSHVRHHVGSGSKINMNMYSLKMIIVQLVKQNIFEPKFACNFTSCGTCGIFF